jgi:Tfp pilus assembly protein PilO
MKALKQHYIGLTFSILFAVATAIGFWKFSILMYTKQNRVREVKEQLAIYKGNKEIFEQETKQLKDLIDRASKLENYVVTPTTLPTFLSSIENLAKENKVDFNITSAQNGGKDANSAKLEISFTARGSLKTIDEFLNKITHQPYQINFTKFYLVSDSAPVDANSPTDTKKTTPIIGTEMWTLTSTMDVISFSI